MGLLVAQGDEGIDLGGSPGWEIGGGKRYQRQDDGYAYKCYGIVGADAEEEAAEEAREGESGYKANPDTKQREAQRFTNDDAKYVLRLRAHGDANADFADALRDGVRHHTVDAHR